MDVDKDCNGAYGAAISKVAEIGLCETVQALTNLTGIPFQIREACSAASAFERVSAIGEDESISVGIYMAVEGDVPGHMASLCTWDSACLMWNALLGAAPESPEVISELEASMLLEVGNIMNAAFLRAVVNQFGVELLATPPAVGVDMTSAILSTIVSNALETEQQALTIRNVIGTDDGEAEWLFLFIAEADDLRRIFGHNGLREVA